MAEEFKIGDQVVVSRQDARTRAARIDVGSLQSVSAAGEASVKIEQPGNLGPPRVVRVPVESLRSVTVVYGSAKVPGAAQNRRILRKY
jgi:hypothetical protein